MMCDDVGHTHIMEELMSDTEPKKYRAKLTLEMDETDAQKLIQMFKEGKLDDLGIRGVERLDSPGAHSERVRDMRQPDPKNQGRTS
jgi:hypothetical protein